MVEEWRDAPGYDGLYEVSNLGNVRSWRSYGPSGARREQPVVLKQHPMSTGYPGVSMRASSQSRRRTEAIHRLVCEAWHGPKPFPEAVVRHLDDDKANNRPENLAWGTPKENHADFYRNRGYSPGDHAPNAKITAEVATDIKRLRSEGLTRPQIRDIHGVSLSQITRIAKGRCWANA